MFLETGPESLESFRCRVVDRQFGEAGVGESETEHILLVLGIAAGEGLRLPLVYNTCGWERPEMFKKLDGGANKLGRISAEIARRLRICGRPAVRSCPAEAAPHAQSP